MTVFDLEHIFIVFAPGAGGNFISGLLVNLITNKLSQLDISSTGSAHISMAKKAAKQDYISFGTFKSESPVTSTNLCLIFGNILVTKNNNNSLHT